MARRVNYIKSFHEKFNGVPTLLVDTGNLFSDQRTKHGETRVDGVEKNEWMLKATDQYPVDAVNLSAADLDYFSRWMARSEFAKRSAAQPVFKRFVSANLLSEAAGLVKLPPFIVREVPLAGSAKPTRLAFVGLMENAAQPPDGVRIADPIESAKRTVPEARRNADLVIVLARLKADVAVRLAREVPGINIIITGTGDMFTPSLRVGDTLIAFTPYETRFLGELRFYKDQQGRLTFRDRYISLDEGVPDDPEALQIVNGVRESKAAVYRSTQALLMNWMGLAKPPSDWDRAKARKEAGAAPSYVSTAACAQCHADQYIKWSNSPHARATDALVRAKDDFDAGCLQCHATGKKAGELPKLTTVQCEECHGPGSLHALNPTKGYGRVGDLKTGCLGCHTSRTSPNFDPQAAWLKIKH